MVDPIRPATEAEKCGERFVTFVQADSPRRGVARGNYRLKYKAHHHFVQLLDIMAVTVPKTQRGAVVEKPGKDAKAVVKEIPVEEPKEGEVLIKMVATGGLCKFAKFSR